MPKAEGSSAAEPIFRFRPPGPRALHSATVFVFLYAYIYIRCAAKAGATCAIPLSCCVGPLSGSTHKRYCPRGSASKWTHTRMLSVMLVQCCMYSSHRMRCDMLTSVGICLSSKDSLCSLQRVFVVVWVWLCVCVCVCVCLCVCEAGTPSTCLYIQFPTTCRAQC